MSISELGAIGEIIVKLREDGYPEDLESLNRLTVEERHRFRLLRDWNNKRPGSRHEIDFEL